MKIITTDYKITFNDSLYVDDSTIVAGKNYNVVSNEIITENFFLYGTKNTSLNNRYIINDDNLVVKSKDGIVYQKNIDYEINYNRGVIKRTETSTMPDNSEFVITYKYYSIFQSRSFNDEDDNNVFNGIKLKLKDFPALAIDEEKTKWSESSITIPYTINIASIGTRKKKYPGDYILTFSDQNISTARKVVSGRMIDIPVNYKVEEISTGISKPIMTLLNEKVKNDSAFTRGDEIIFFAPGAQGTLTDTLTWGVTLTKVTATDSVKPGDGYSLLIYTQRPFTKEDIFTFSTEAGFVSNQMASSKLDNIYVVPNPYIVTNEIEPTNKIPGQNRGERRIYFENLPMKCTIRIFTLSGELVTTIEHETGMDNGREYWNLLNRDGFSVSYGLYIAHIDAPEVGEKLIKFAIIK
ncbi:MAG TPA: hypothetical protein PK073_11790 [Ignavibacteriaceae bacterium]|nr:hypothetical protein [Ignavibacteriaceae bacterium]